MFPGPPCLQMVESLKHQLSQQKACVMSDEYLKQHYMVPVEDEKSLDGTAHLVLKQQPFGAFRRLACGSGFFMLFALLKQVNLCLCQSYQPQSPVSKAKICSEHMARHFNQDTSAWPGMKGVSGQHQHAHEHETRNTLSSCHHISAGPP